MCNLFTGASKMMFFFLVRKIKSENFIKNNFRIAKIL